MTTVEWRKFHSWSGCKISGTKKYELAESERNEHMKRALWLTARIEGGGTFGAINSYDGAAMSAGLEHKIALFPKSMTQGSLWGLLAEMERHSPCQELENLWDTFRHGPGWYVSQDGKVREFTTGRLVSGQDIRETFSPPGGKVPRRGESWEKAKQWAILFHELFSAEVTHQVQINSAIKSLLKGRGNEEAEAYKISVGIEHPTNLVAGDNIKMGHDLAWCVYHSYSVNAPSKARKRLRDSGPSSSIKYPEKLIRILGTTRYGRWHDTSDGTGNRYDRTRVYAMKSGFWPEELFIGPSAIMPKNI